MAIQNRQDMIIPECALKPERVHQMIKKMEDAATRLKSEAKKRSRRLKRRGTRPVLGLKALTRPLKSCSYCLR